MDNDDYINGLLNERATYDQRGDKDRVKSIDEALDAAGYKGDKTVSPSGTPGWQQEPPVNTAGGIEVNDSNEIIDNNRNEKIGDAPVLSNDLPEGDPANENLAHNDQTPVERAVKSPPRGTKR